MWEAYLTWQVATEEPLGALLGVLVGVALLLVGACALSLLAVAGPGAEPVDGMRSPEAIALRRYARWEISRLELEQTLRGLREAAVAL